MSKVLKKVFIALLLGAAAKVSWRPIVIFRYMVAGKRRPMSRTPAAVGLPYEDVSFPAIDDVRLQGWFIPAGGDGSTAAPAVVFVHGWPWNRLGNEAGHVPFPDRDVDALVTARALHHAGYNVLLFDLRNHGESDGDLPLTFGVKEGRDFAGAVEMVGKRPEVDPERIGAIGYSAGGNTVLYGLPLAPPVKAAILVQPTKVPSFNLNFARTEFGVFARPILLFANFAFWLLRAPLSAHNPAIPAREAGATIIRYVQGSGDKWGSMEMVQEMASATPHALEAIVVAPSTERYGGYQYLENQLEEVVAFFDEYLK